MSQKSNKTLLIKLETYNSLFQINQVFPQTYLKSHRTNIKLKITKHSRRFNKWHQWWINMKTVFQIIIISLLRTEVSGLMRIKWCRLIHQPGNKKWKMTDCHIWLEIQKYQNRRFFHHNDQDRKRAFWNHNLIGPSKKVNILSINKV